MTVTPRENVSIMTAGENNTTIVELKIRQKWNCRKTPQDRYIVSKTGVSINLEQQGFDKYFAEIINE